MEQFKRVVEVNVADKTFISELLHIEFEIPFDDDPYPNESEIRIYNLSDDSINLIQRNQTLTINAGYEGDVGVLLEGRVSYIATKLNGPDKVTSIYVLDSPDLSSVKVEKKSYAKGVRASTILKDMIPKLKLPLAAFKLPRDKSYPKGYTISGEITGYLEQLAKDCGASFYVSRGKLYVRPLADGDDAQFILRPETGLILSPEYFEDKDGIKGYNIQCLLQHRIATASIIDLDARYAKGRFRVRRGKHVSSPSDFLTHAEVVENVIR